MSLPGPWLFLLAPIALASVLLWRFPACRRVRLRSLVVYVVVMSLLIGGALELVAFIAGGRVVWTEIIVVLWFTIAWRLGWTLWSKTVGRWGQRWVRWGRIRRRSEHPVPLRVRLIPAGRATLTLLIFATAFLSTVVTHRCKIADGTDPRAMLQLPFSNIRIPTSDGLMLDGWFIPDGNADRAIVICHGAGANKGNFIWFAAPLSHRGYNLLFFDFRAHGASDGRTTSYGLRERLDVIAAVDWLKRHEPDRSRLVIGLGSSQGSMALALAAGEDTRIDAIILDSPFVSPYELVMDRARYVPVIGPLFAHILLAEVSLQTGENFFTLSAERAVAALGRRPVMVIHGSEDPVMPAAHSQRLYDAATGPRDLWFGPGPHSNIVTTDPTTYGQRVTDFLETCFGRPQNTALRDGG